jgi:hypothetical protein
VPPTLRVVPQNKQITARKGSTVTLECKASGNPVPTIYWHKKVSFFLLSIISFPSCLYICGGRDNGLPLFGSTPRNTPFYEVVFTVWSPGQNE